MTLPTQIHGHDVLDMMTASGATYTRASLAAAIHAKFGPDARYHTCSAEGMTAEQLNEVGREIETRVLSRAVQYEVEHRVLLIGRRTVVFAPY